MSAATLSLLWIVLGIALLVYLIVGLKVHNIIALLLAGIFIAFAEKMPIEKIVPTIEKGIGGILSTLALIVIFGAIVGELMTESGASQQLADTIVDKMGKKYISVALLIIGMIFGMSMFYEVAFLITVPLVLSIAKETKIPYMRLIIPTVAGATMGHSIFPPQPGPMALVTAFHADIAQVYIWGLVVILPTIFCAGILVRRFIPNLDKIPLGSVMKPAPRMPKDQLPSFGISLLVPLMPAIIIIASSVVKSFTNSNNWAYKFMNFIGSAEISMLITVIVAMIAFGYRRGKSGNEITSELTKAIKNISNVLLVIAAGGVMKEVIIDSGVGNIIVHMCSKLPLSPLILAWFITILIRVLTGQGAVAAITAAGIVAPMITIMHVNPVLMVLACACGSNTMTLMYDGGFLLFQQTFGISLKDTFKTWDVLEFTNSFVGLLMVLLLSLFLH